MRKLRRLKYLAAASKSIYYHLHRGGNLSLQGCFDRIPEKLRRAYIINLYPCEHDSGIAITRGKHFSVIKEQK